VHRLAPLALAVVAVLAAGARPTAVQPACEFNGVERIVAVGDVHGAYDRFLEILKVAGVVDNRGRWSGGKTHLLQVGDVLDRGDDSLKAVDLLKRLEGEAQRAGGRVHALIGNHEAMRMIGDFRYVVPGEYKAFVDRDSSERKQRYIENAPEDQRERLQKEIPLGMIEMVVAFGPKGPYGSRLRTLNAAVKINGIVFLHGGISPATAMLSCAAINETVRRELTEDLEKTRGAPTESLTTKVDGPLWYRGLAQEPETFEPQVTEILTAQQARAIVVGHTVTSSGRIESRFGGRVVLIDTGMQPAYVKEGRASALEIRGDVFTAIYRDSRAVVGR
jgi:hypothetical protein